MLHARTSPFHRPFLLPPSLSPRGNARQSTLVYSLIKQRRRRRFHDGGTEDEWSLSQYLCSLKITRGRRRRRRISRGSSPPRPPISPLQATLSRSEKVIIVKTAPRSDDVFSVGHVSHLKTVWVPNPRVKSSREEGRRRRANERCVAINRRGLAPEGRKEGRVTK